jgi:hypothetical protein
MVDYHDPVTVAQELGAYAFPSGSGAWDPIYLFSFSTEVLVKLWHVVNGIYM